MKPLMAVLAALLATGMQAQAQAACSSDGQPAPMALVERFISADCAACWSDPATPAMRRGELAIDWIVPSPLGDDAPLSAAASRDALARLSALGQPVPATSAHTASPTATAPRTRLRVAHGVPLGGYVGASIAMQAIEKAKPFSGPWTAWLLLVETIPAGVEGTPVERNLARNLLTVPWSAGSAIESRVMGIPEGAQPGRLRVIGWVQDTAGRVVSIAQSRCTVPR